MVKIKDGFDLISYWKKLQAKASIEALKEVHIIHSKYNKNKEFNFLCDLNTAIIFEKVSGGKLVQESFVSEAFDLDFSKAEDYNLEDIKSKIFVMKEKRLAGLFPILFRQCL